MQPPDQVLYSPLGSQINFPEESFFRTLRLRENVLLVVLQNLPPTTQSKPSSTKPQITKPRKPSSSRCKRLFDTASEKPDSLVPAAAETAPQPPARAPKKPRLTTQPATRAPPVSKGCQGAKGPGEVPKRVTRSATRTAEKQPIAKVTRRAAFRQAKRDAQIPVSQQPEKVKRPYMELPKSSGGHKIKDKSGNLIKTRDYYYKNREGKKIIIQDHGAGHEKGNQGPHFNVRPIDKSRKGNVEGTRAHYPFDK